jgi:pilus assembly protein CpaB
VKRSNRLVILVGVLLAVLAFVGIVIILNQEQPAEEVEQTTVPVLVAVEDIAIGDEVIPELVEIQEVQPDQVVGTRIGSTTQVSGQRALYDIPAGSQIPGEAIGLGQGGDVCIECQLNPGEKAVAFQVDRVTGLDFLVQAGDHVDIVVSQNLQVVQPTEDSLEDPEGPQRFETIPGLENSRTVKTILQDKRVLYVSATRIRSTAVQQTPAPGEDAPPAQPAQQIENVIIVFAGTDQDAEVIKFAQNDVNNVGPLTAVLRSTDDTDVEVTTGITIDLLVENYGLPIPDIIADLGEEAAP